jgi:predicted TIM-barrel fold metal-dependent hydrolase
MFIDIHAHAVRKPFLQVDGRKPFPTAEQLIEHYDKIGVDKACLLPLIGPEFYSGQSNEDILDMAEKYPERFIPFCNIHPRSINNSVDAPLADVLKKYKDIGCRGVGEVICNIPFTDPFAQNLFKNVQEAGLPLTFHIAHRLDRTYGLYDDPGLPLLEATLQNYPELVFLGHSQTFWAEIGQLETPGDRAGYPSYPIKAEGAVPKLMRKYQNLCGDLSAGSGCNALTRDPEYAVTFLEEFQDRLLFGLDICCPPDGNEPRLMTFLKELLADGKITESVFDKVTHLNAIRLLNL